MLKTEINIWKDKVKKNVTVLLDAPSVVLADPEFMLEAVNINTKAFNYADVSLKSSRVFLLEVIKRDGLLLRNAHIDLQNDLDLVIPALTNNATLFKYLPVEVKTNKQAICAAISSPRGDFLLEAAIKIKDNRELMLFAVSCRGTNLMFASDRLKDDKEVVIAALDQNWLALGFASSRLKGNLEILTYAIKKNSSALRFANRSLLQDKDWARIVILANALTLEKLQDFNEDKTLVRLALEGNEQSYKFVGENLKKDKEFIASVALNNYKLFMELDEDLRADHVICINTWRAICGAFVKDHEWFFSAITSVKLLEIWEEYRYTHPMATFARFPDFYMEQLQKGEID